MSWRNQGITGANNIPLGSRRRFGGDRDDGDDGGYNPSEPAVGLSDLKRGRSPEPRDNSTVATVGTKRRKRGNRWGAAEENKAAGLMGLPTAIYASMTQEQLDAYVTHVRIEEITQKLRINDVVPNEDERSISPPPQYDNFGRRINTREYRYRKRLEDERHKLVEKAIKIIPNYRPPGDYRRPTKTQEKVYVPVNDYPEINFIGLLIGPRGNTLKKMETESGAKIAIRGKGSVKEGKGRSDAAHTSNQEEDLHCLIMADSEDKVNKAKKLIHNIIETAASIPEGQNELKRNQLRELAALNGTLRDDENQACQNCGQIGHRKYDCPERKNVTANIICRSCGNAGHLARDCPDKRGAFGGRGGWDNNPNAITAGNFDSYGAPAGRITGGDTDRDYEALMEELAGGGPRNNGQAPGDSNGQAQGQRPRPPWESAQPSGSLPPWKQNRNQDGGVGGGSGGPPPWQRSGGNNGGDNYGGYRNDNRGNYGGAPGGAAPPWKRNQSSGAPPPPPGQDSYSYGGNNYGYNSGGSSAAPPGLGALFQGYGGMGGVPPPPPPGDAPPPPPPPGPPSDQPPPPPPPGA